MRSWQPASPDLALLRTCLAPPDQTRERLRVWEALQPWDDLNDGALRLVPYLYRKLERDGVTSDRQGLLKGTYARFWYLFHQEALPGQEFLSASGHDRSTFLLLKGMALQGLVYDSDPPTRPVRDVDILVRPEDVPSWQDDLHRADYLPESDYSTAYALRHRKSGGYRRGASSVDLNWRIHEFSADPGIEARMFTRAQSVSVRGQEFRTLSHTDHLLHTLLHGSPWNPTPPFRWILDAELLIRTGRVDWELFVDEVGRCGWRTPVRDLLAYLAQAVDSATPSRVHAALDALPRCTPGALAHFSLSRSTRLGRRMSRALFAETLMDRDFSVSSGWWLRLPAADVGTLARMGREYRTVRDGHAT